METRFSRMCDAVIEAGWLAALVVTPLFFNTYSSRVFEPDKLHLLRSIALIMAAVWIAQLLDTGLRPGLRERIRRTPLVLPALILVVAYLVSTALSVVPRVSLLGSYVRLQGTFTFLSYVVIFAMVLTHLRSRAQISRIIHTVILTSLPISIYGLIQHYGLDPLPWGGDVQQRVAANMGNAIFVAAYLIMAVFLTLERLVHSAAAVLSPERGTTVDALRAGAYLFVLAVQVIAIIFTQSRGPWLGLAAGLYIFGLLGMLLLGRWAEARPDAPAWMHTAVRPAWFTMMGLTVAAVAFLVVFNLPQSPLTNLRSKPYIGRMGTILSTEEGTNAVRVLIWDGVVDMMLTPHPPIESPESGPDALNAIRPLIGYGPESMWVAFNRFYPPELAHYEARNASPDRSHNETFDTLVRTGLVGFGAQLFIFGSVFYYALRWLGLMQGRARHNLFLALLISGALLGVVIPWLVEGSLRLAGVGLPAGLIAGVILYVTMDLLLFPAESQIPTTPSSRERQLLILAILAAIAAHFVEVHFGIAIAATLTHFWVLAAVLVVVGMDWIQDETQAAPVMVPETRTLAAAPKKRAKDKKWERVAERATPRSLAAPTPSTYRAFLPYVGIAALVTLVLTWDYLVNQTGAQGAFAVLWNAFTVRVDASGGTLTRSPVMLLLLLTWLVGGLLAMGETYARHHRAGRFPWGKGIAAYAAGTVGVFLAYGLLQAGRTSVVGLSGMEIFERVAGHIVVFDVFLLLLALALAWLIRSADPRPQPAAWFRAAPALPLAGGAVAAVAALLIVINANIDIVQADIYYKQGQAYESNGSWEGAILLYEKAARLEPQEDYYRLFLGRALLEFAMTMPPGTPRLPEKIDDLPTERLLPLAQQALQTREREDLTRAAHAVLLSARRLNSLNMDHTANLARLFRSWAFAGATDIGQPVTNAALRDIVATQPETVDLAKLERSVAYYLEAAQLSPHNVQLGNELASVQYIQGDSEAALATLDRSAQLDAEYYQTFLFKGDILADLGDTDGALNAYRQAGYLRPRDVAVQNVVGVYSAQVGDLEGALDAFAAVIETESSALTSAEQQLAELEALANGAGGYDRLGRAANDRRTALENSIASHRSQLHIAYRNQALILRDAGRIAEALAAAQTALSIATDEQRPAVEQLIAELESRQAG